jgi:predicted nucleic acid-binding Zn ribbon protein
MHLNIPPIIPYAIGAMLVIFGVLRAKYLGAPRSPRITEEDAETSTNQPPVRGKEQRRHRRMGVVWVLLGLFLVVSTYVQTHRR